MEEAYQSLKKMIFIAIFLKKIIKKDDIKQARSVFNLQIENCKLGYEKINAGIFFGDNLFCM